jgi:preprotein translocase subunit SecD
VLAVVIVAMYATMVGTGNTTPKLGLDLEGGTTVTLNPRLAQGQGKPQSGAINQAVDVIRNRVNGLGVAGATVVRAGNRIEISVPGKGREQVLNLVGTTAELRFRQVFRVTGGTDNPAADSASTPTPNATKSAASTPTPKATATPKSTSSPAASPTASKRVLSQGLLAATTPTPTSTPTAATSPKAAASPAASPSAAASPTAPPEVFTSQSQCANLSHTAASGQPSPWSVCMYETVKCPTFKPDTANEKPGEFIVACEPSTGLKYLLQPARLVGTDVKGATATIPQTQTGAGQWEVVVSFTGKGQSKFTQLTKDTVNAPQPTNQVAIVLDGIVQSAPTTNDVINGDAQITGNFSEKEANNLADVLKYGALPLAFDRDQAQSISATLGTQSLHAGLLAGAIGLGLVIIYSLIYYRLLAIVTVASLSVSALLVYASVVLLGQAIDFTLTLAGIAGLIVAVGITADSFVVYFERLKDEIRDGRTMRTAVEVGWTRARRTILSADTVSLLAAVILYIVSIGDVRGFAFTLGLSTLLDIVVVFLFTKPLVTLLVRNKFWATSKFSGLSANAVGGQPSAGRYRASRPRTSGQAASPPATGGGA